MNIDQVSRLAVAVILAGAGATADAQGTLSTQGFGYPPGQLSTEVLGSGGALAEFDARSPLNPAAMAFVPATTIFAQYEPEFRRTSIGDVSERSSASRFPLFGVVGRAGARTAVGLSASTLLDRSWATIFDGTTDANGESVSYTDNFASRGSLNDLRVSGAWLAGRQFALGVGAHLLTGENRLELSRAYDDTAFAPYVQTSRVDYSGSAFSAGAVWLPSRVLALALSARLGGRLRLNQGGEQVGSASVPGRVAANLRYTGLTGASVGVRGEWQGWSSMNGLGTEEVVAQDVWEIGAGAEFPGFRVIGAPLMFRVGTRWRTLPFTVGGEAPNERSLTAGFGVPLAGGRVLLDFAAQRASRSALDARESSWIISTGVALRP